MNNVFSQRLFCINVAIFARNIVQDWWFNYALISIHGNWIGSIRFLSSLNLISLPTFYITFCIVSFLSVLIYMQIHLCHCARPMRIIRIRVGGQSLWTEPSKTNNPTQQSMHLFIIWCIVDDKNGGKYRRAEWENSLWLFMSVYLSALYSVLSI